MGMPAAVMGDSVVGIDTHIVMVPAPPAPPVPTPLPHPFSGKIMGGCITTVMIQGKPAAVVGSTVNNLPPHIPTPPGTAFGPPPPQNNGTVFLGSTTVLIGGKQAARVTDKVTTCSTPPVPGNSTIVGPGVPTVMIG